MCKKVLQYEQSSRGVYGEMFEYYLSDSSEQFTWRGIWVSLKVFMATFYKHFLGGLGCLIQTSHEMVFISSLELLIKSKALEYVCWLDPSFILTSDKYLQA